MRFPRSGIDSVQAAKIRAGASNAWTGWEALPDACPIQTSGERRPWESISLCMSARCFQ
jgi:hypothetical protein